MLNEAGVADLSGLAGVLGIYHTPKEMKRFPAGYNAKHSRKPSRTANMTGPVPSSPPANTPAATATVDVAVSVDLKCRHNRMHHSCCVF